MVVKELERQPAHYKEVSGKEYVLRTRSDILFLDDKFIDFYIKNQVPSAARVSQPEAAYPDFRIL
ncbi:hypothetical protein [Komagataeibacter europaeus]|uniref:hypothetical protein n=1 Tax=Komagataeibacter europaeus TaxID=33995 RepID=UPI001FC94224|nr:hypothetical protein [Komagataeibacter europaeus]